MKPRLLDLFCKAGGAGKGYADAGFEVVGVDIEPQPNYPFEFYQADVLALVQDQFNGCWHEQPTASALPGRLAACLGHFDAIHASPPCQAFSDLAWHPQNRAVEYPDLIGPTRALLRASGLPYVIENVEGAPLIDPMTLCGSSFGLPLRRHRLFEMNFPAMALPCAHGALSKRFRVWRHGREIESAFVPVYGTGGGKAAEHWPEAMGIDWMTRAELSQAIPPAYTAYIGEWLLAAVERERTSTAL